jgi:uncharacterized protein YutE (UPF0331/DUF86 family)
VAVERLLDRIIMRAIDINEHLIGELGAGEGRSTHLNYRDTFLLLASLNVYPQDLQTGLHAAPGSATF